jgi:photosystem II stability/assembly factor-like uncharacterized protein
MKKITFLLSILFIAAGAFAQWTVPHYAPDYNELHFINGLATGYAAADYGILRKTTDGGLNWTNLRSGTTANLRTVSFESFSDEYNKGYAAGDNGILLKTTNGGTNWTAQNTGTSTTINDIDVARGDTVCAVTANGNVLRTTNGGINWTSQVVEAGASIEAIFYYSFTFGYITTSTGKVYITNNAGASWTLRTTPVSTPLYDIAVSGSTIIAVGFDGVILRSTTAATSWTMTHIRGSSPSIKCIIAYSPSVFIAGNQEGTIIRTTNSGDTYEEIPPPKDGRFSIESIGTTGAFTLLAVGERGLTFRTTDTGAEWTALNGVYVPFGEIESMDFASTQVGYIISDGNVYRTINGGVNWMLYNVPFGDNFRSVYFLNSVTGYVTCTGEDDASGAGGYVFKTTNAGISWVVSQLDHLMLTKIHFADSSNGWLLGEPGFLQDGGSNSLYRTTNGGGSWLEINSFNENVIDMQFVSGSTGWAILESGLILRTTNGGINWGSTGTAPFSPEAIHFPTAQRGYMCGENGNIYVTTNGGVNWAAQTSGTNSDLYDIYFGSNDKGICVGELGKRLITTNGGQTWISQDEPSQAYMYVCHMPDNLLALTAGAYGYISRNINVATGTEPVISITPSLFKLGQNYPNPFNPKTSINYQCKITGNVSLDVYDAGGRLICNLVSGVKSEGEHSVTFDGSRLPSGVYFYRLEAGEHTETRKMMLVK